MQNLTNQWQTLHYPAPRRLETSTLQLHHAAQLVAMVGNSYLPKKDDDSHTNLEWLPDHQALAGNWVNKNITFRLTLRYLDFTLAWLEKSGKTLAKLSLDGQTKAAATNWMKQVLQQKLNVSPNLLQSISHYDMPHHAVADGAPFQLIDRQFHEELAAYRNNAHYILGTITEDFEHASPVRTWPHHFDTGVYIPVAFNRAGDAIKSVGIGLAIPDKDVDDYYFYVNHWTQDNDADTSTLPELPTGGHWHTRGWTGAILPASAILQMATAELQADLTKSFLKKGIEASLKFIQA